MTASLSVGAEITVLDVGHGNAAVVRCSHGTIVVDAAPGTILPEELDRTSITRIDHLVLSHADRDHIGGAVGLLSGELAVGTLWFNPDSLKQSDVFDDLRAMAFHLHEQGLLDVATNLNTGARNAMSLGNVEVTVVHPDIMGAAIGPREAGHRHGAASANSMSGVLRVSVDGIPQVLFSADIDAAGLAELLGRRIDLTARVLVFPHHGGRSGGNDRAFAAQLCSAVQPEIVVLSLGRRGYRNPQPAIIAGVRESVPQAHIMCTQLSTRCQAADVHFLQSHLAERPAAGRVSGACCAGSAVLTPTGDDQPVLARHEAFIADNVEAPLCRERARSSEGPAQRQRG